MKHKHHILPHYLGGTDEPSNITEITIEEHAEAHRLLYEQHGNWQDYLAWQGLSGRMGKEEIIRYKISQTHKGKKLSPEHIEILREKGKKLTGNNNPMFGKNQSEKCKLAVSKTHKGKIISEQTKKNMSIASTGRLHSEETKNNLSKIFSQRWKDGKYDAEKLRLSRIGFKQPESQKLAVAAALSKKYMVTNPAGESYEITNLRKFCTDNNLDQGNMSAVASGRQKTCKGWKCSRIQESQA